MENKIKVFSLRSDLIGDTVSALPALNIIKIMHPNSYIYFSLMKKCAQAAPLFEHHPLIDEITISEFDEGFGEKDEELKKSCDLVINTRPTHNDSLWFHKWGIVYESVGMTGLSMDIFNSLPEEEKIPKLYRYWKLEKENSISVWPFAGYGRGFERSPSKEQWESILLPFSESFKIYHFGHPSEPNLNIPGIERKTDLSFFEQIKLANNCKITLNTDSGSGIVLAALAETNQITICTNFNPGHVDNITALCVCGKLSQCIGVPNGFNNLNIEEVQQRMSNILDK